jgi:hypothetical protein
MFLSKRELIIHTNFNIYKNRLTKQPLQMFNCLLTFESVFVILIPSIQRFIFFLISFLVKSLFQ